jgi:hypothetical protein
VKSEMQMIGGLEIHLRHCVIPPPAEDRDDESKTAFFDTHICDLTRGLTE